MSEAIERFAAPLQLSDRMLQQAERQDLEVCARILAVQCAQYRAKFGEVSMSDALDLLASETIDDDQASWLADGKEMIVGVLGTLEEEKPKH